jgi:hypothetical protein
MLENDNVIAQTTIRWVPVYPKATRITSMAVLSLELMNDGELTDALSRCLQSSDGILTADVQVSLGMADVVIEI